MKTLKDYILVFTGLALLVSSGCSSCNKPPSPLQGDLLIGGEIGDCNYDNLATSGQQDINIVVTGKNGFSRTYPISNSPNQIYSIEVPSQGSFTITVEAAETDNQTCPSCQIACPGGGNGKPRWKGSENFLKANQAGLSWPVTIKLVNRVEDCLC